MLLAPRVRAPAAYSPHSSLTPPPPPVLCKPASALRSLRCSGTSHRGAGPTSCSRLGSARALVDKAAASLNIPRRSNTLIPTRKNSSPVASITSLGLRREDVTGGKQSALDLHSHGQVLLAHERVDERKEGVQLHVEANKHAWRPGAFGARTSRILLYLGGPEERGTLPYLGGPEERGEARVEVRLEGECPVAERLPHGRDGLHAERRPSGEGDRRQPTPSLSARRRCHKSQ